MTFLSVLMLVTVILLLVIACIGGLVLIGYFIDWAWKSGSNILAFVVILVVFIIFTLTISTGVYLFQILHQ